MAQRTRVWEDFAGTESIDCGLFIHSFSRVYEALSRVWDFVSQDEVDDSRKTLQ